jgi:hypothetical protein
MIISLGPRGDRFAFSRVIARPCPHREPRVHASESISISISNDDHYCEMS